MSNADKFSVVLPVFNEQDNLQSLFAEIRAAADSTGRPWEAVFVDDCSTDRSLDIIRELADKHTRGALRGLCRESRPVGRLLRRVRCGTIRYSGHHGRGPAKRPGGHPGHARRFRRRLRDGHRLAGAAAGHPGQAGLLEDRQQDQGFHRGRRGARHRLFSSRSCARTCCAASPGSRICTAIFPS